MKRLKVEGMMIREEGKSAFYCVSFQTITGFTYERGHEYELLVMRTTLANSHSFISY
jgi:hypothetical protein